MPPHLRLARPFAVRRRLGPSVITRLNQHKPRENGRWRDCRLIGRATPCRVVGYAQIRRLKLPDPHRPDPKYRPVMSSTSRRHCSANGRVLRENGRRGSPGTLRLTSYERRADAEAAERRTLKRRLQHGYRRQKPVD